MPPIAPLLLAFDTAGLHCAAVLLRGPDRLSGRHAQMARGQAEQLMPLLQHVLAEAGVGWRDLDALAVGIGPGNFTGTRIAVAAARGLALALQRPAFGVSLFEVLADSHAVPDTATGPTLLSLPAPRDRVHVQPFLAGQASGPAALIDPAAPDLPWTGLAGVLGHRAEEIGAALGLPARTAMPPADPTPAIAVRALAALRAGVAPDRPAPLYVRPADAAPSSDVLPALLP